MPISLRSSRNDLVERVLSRIKVSLCWTSGCLTIVTPSMIFSSVLLENRSIADDAQWGRAVSRAFMRDLASRRPRTALQNLRQRQREGVRSDTLAQTFRQPVEKRNRQRAPLDHQGRG